jgi:hypothetical protein
MAVGHQFVADYVGFPKSEPTRLESSSDLAMHVGHRMGQPKDAPLADLEVKPENFSEVGDWFVLAGLGGSLRILDKQLSEVFNRLWFSGNVHEVPEQEQETKRSDNRAAQVAWCCGTLVEAAGPMQQRHLCQCSCAVSHPMAAHLSGQAPRLQLGVQVANLPPTVAVCGDVQSLARESQLVTDGE